MRVTPKGELDGLPFKIDVGAYSGRLCVSDGAIESCVDCKGLVVSKASKPKWLENFFVLPDAHEDMNYSVDLNRFVVIPNNLTPKFQMLTKSKWLKLSESGILMGVPKRPDVGSEKVVLKVSVNYNGTELYDITLVDVLILRTNHPPYWRLNPIRLRVSANGKFLVNLNSYAVDPDGDILTFVAGMLPSWTRLSLDGILAINPGDVIGDHAFKLRVSDGSGLSDTTAVIITVEK